MSKKYAHRNNHRRHDNYVPPYDAAILAEPVSNAGFSEEVLSKLQNGKVNLLMDIVKRTERDMYRIHTFNKKNLFEVKRVLQNKKLNFRPEPIREEDSDKAPIAPINAQDKTPFSSKGDQKRQNNNTASQGNFVKESVGQNGSRKNRRGGLKNNERNLNNRNKQVQKQDDRFVRKPSNKRIWDADGVSEHSTKLEHEKKRPKKPIVTLPRDIYIKINKNDKWGFSNRNGKEVVPPIYDEVFVYKEDLCCVEKDGLFGYIDREGNEVIPIEYDCALSFSEGYACVYKNNQCGYINKNNEIVIELKFDAGTSVMEGNCRVKKDGKWGELHLDNPNEIRWIN